MRIGARTVSALFAAVSAAALWSPVATAQTKLVTFEEVVANPGDLRLSLTYAQQQSRAGNLEQAAGTLERLLLVQPNWDGVRLFYAKVLYRADDLEGSRRELDLLKTRPLSPDQMLEVDNLLKEIDHKQSPIHGNFGISIGGRVDSNAGSVTNSDDIYRSDLLVQSHADERIDGAFLASMNFRLEYQPSQLTDNNLFIQLNGRLRDQIELDSDTLATTYAGGGATLYLEDLKLIPEGFYSTVFLGDELVLDSAGGKLRAEYDLTPRVTLLASGEGAVEDFHATGSDSTRELRDGWRAEGGGGLRIKVSNQNRLTAEASYLRKEADVGWYSYDGPEVHVHDQMFLGKGRYLAGDLWYWHFDYDDPDPGVNSTMTREDDRYRFRLAYGTPLSTVFDTENFKLPDPIGKIRLQVSGTYFKLDSNLPNYRQENLSGDVTLTRNFNF